MRRMLLEPTTAPRASPSSGVPPRVIRVSRTSSRSRTAAMVRSDRGSTGRSFSECTAMSTAPSISARSIRSVNTPSPPISGSADRPRPIVDISTMEISVSDAPARGLARRAPATGQDAMIEFRCGRSWRTRLGWFGEGEQVA